MATSAKKREQHKRLSRNTQLAFIKRMAVNHDILNKLMLEEVNESR
jgi:hypothetical protein